EPIRVSIAEDLAVILTKDAFEQLFGWAYSVSCEISCLGSVHREGNRFFIEKFYLLKQAGSFGGTVIDQDAIAEFMEQLITESKGNEAQRIKCWAHSHPNMDVFWSMTDETTCRQLVNDYLISIVVSNNFVIRCRIDITTPVPVTFDNVPVFYHIPKDKLLMEQYAEQVRSTVSESALSFVRKQEVQTQQQEEYMPEFPCEYCGGWHDKSECPLADSDQLPTLFDDSDSMF
ncbi:MAG: hypothetical protein KAX05_12230, partial [Bacteroidales bacterium]|nr:hypothetical protein [Bacteroidales bacterium]